MQIFPGTYGRERVYDRGPTVGALRYEAEAVGPHVRTLRDSFIIPLNKRCRISIISATMIRTAVSSDLQKALVEVVAEPLEGGELPFQLALLYNKNLGERVDNTFALELYANPGTTLNLYTTDESASGALLYITYLVYQLFTL